MQMKRAGGGRLGRARRESLSSRSLPEMRRVMGLRFRSHVSLWDPNINPGSCISTDRARCSFLEILLIRFRLGGVAVASLFK